VTDFSLPHRLTGRCRLTPHGITAAWWPLRCKFGRGGAAPSRRGSESTAGSSLPEASGATRLPRAALADAIGAIETARPNEAGLGLVPLGAFVGSDVPAELFALVRGDVAPRRGCRAGGHGPKMVGPASLSPSVVRKWLSPPSSELAVPLTSLSSPPLTELSVPSAPLTAPPLTELYGAPASF
jgi:hypothetical protein